MKKRKGEILIENVIFIILNLVFLAILILFLVKQGSGAVFLERLYSKQISLIIDASLPGTIVKINMEKAYQVAQDKDFSFDKIVHIKDNVVLVQLSKDSGTRYAFFNDVAVSAYPVDKYYYVLTIDEKI